MLFDDIFLLQDIYVDLHVVDVDAVDIFQEHVVHWTVAPGNACDFRGLDSVILQKMGSTAWVFLLPFSDPPIIAEAFDGTLAHDVDVLAVSEREEVKNFILAIFVWPLLIMRRCL